MAMEQISSRKNAYIRHVRRLAADGAYRRERGEYLCDGMKTLREALDFGAKVTSSPGPLVTAAIRGCRKPGKLRCALILEGVQDPGNVGTVIRTANAFGIDAVILTGGCADLYHPKTVRSTMGAIFRQNVLELELTHLADFLREQELPLYGAALAEDAQSIRGMDLRRTALAVGSEGRGLSAELLAMCEKKIIIPMRPDSESLNAAVAASVLMWEQSRQN